MLMSNEGPRVSKSQQKYKHEERRAEFEQNARQSQGDVEQMSEEEEDRLMQRNGEEDDSVMSFVEVAAKQEQQVATFLYIPQLLVAGTVSSENHNVVIGSVPQWTLVQVGSVARELVKELES